MKLFKKLSKRKKEKDQIGGASVALKSRDEIVGEMYGKDEDCVDGKVLKVIYSSDKSKRVIFYLSDKGYVSYIFENLHIFDEEEILYFSRVNYWDLSGSGRNKSLYATLEEAMKQVIYEPEFKAYFAEDDE